VLPEHLTIVLAILFFSTLTRSTFGFGDALVGMPLLTMVAGIQFATPLIAMVASTIAITILIFEWKNVEMSAALRLILSTIVGIPVGLFYLDHLPDTVVKVVLASVIILFALFSLMKPGKIGLKNDRSSIIFGFIAGILGGAYNTNGPPVIIYGTLRGWDQQKFRATLQGYFLPTGGGILIGHGLAGLWTAEVVRSYLLSLPIIMLAIFIGGWLHRRIPRERFTPFVHIMLVIIGIFLLMTSLISK
jgi:uncharacterized membrane protein YfcA